VWANNKYGRHRLLLWGGLSYLLSSGLQAGAPATESGLGMAIVGRLFVGFGMALCNQAGPVSGSAGSIWRGAGCTSLLGGGLVVNVSAAVWVIADVK